MNEEKIKLKITKFERNENNLHYPIVELENIGRVFVYIKVLSLSLNGESNSWIGQELEIIKRTKRKYIYYLIDLRQFNFPDLKEWELKKVDIK